MSLLRQLLNSDGPFFRAAGGINHFCVKPRATSCIKIQRRRYLVPFYIFGAEKEEEDDWGLSDESAPGGCIVLSGKRGKEEERHRE